MMLNYGRHHIDQKDLREVIKSLKGNFLTQGTYLQKLEKYSKKYFKVKNVICCNSGTAAIHLALMSIGLKKGDNVIIPAINFVAASNISKIMGANIFFSDIDQDSFQINAKTVVDCIKKNNLKKVKVIFSMHLGGAPIHHNELYLLKKKLKCYLIEDACHALGGRYYENNFPVGSCKYSDITTFSLHPVKSITSGEGGMLTTNNKNLADKVLALRSHGIVKKKNYYYDVRFNSLNYRISDINCALAFSQIKKIKIFIEKRIKIAERYSENLKKYNDFLEIVNFKKKNYSAWHLLIIKINFKKINLSYNSFFQILLKNKIQAQLHYLPTYKFTIFKKKKKKLFFLKNSEFYSKNCLSIPLYYDLKITEVDYVSKVIKNILDKYLKK